MSQNIEDIKKTEKIDISNQNLKEIPKEIKKTKALKTFLIQQNEIQKIPQFMSKLRTLTTLNFSENKIETIPNGLFGLTSLETLDLSNNNIKDVPEKMKNLRNLKQLDLSINRISEIPKDILSDFMSLKVLGLYRNRIGALPFQIGSLRNLKELHLDVNKLEKWSPGISLLRKLRVLKISQNMITKLPEKLEIAGMSKLLNLDISDNFLTELPDSVSSFKKIKILIANRNKISKVSPLIHELGDLEVLKLDRNELKNFPENPQVVANSLITLSLNENQFEQIPAIFKEMRSLIDLSLNRNNIKEFTIELENLKGLDLSKNSISNISSSALSSLTKLEYLFMDHNNISHVPSSIGALACLRILYMSSNKIQKLPDTFCVLEKLEEISLSSNLINVLPKDIGRLQNLSKLSLDNNNLRKLPESFSNLRNLSVLILSGNKFKNFPLVITKLKRLEILHISLCFLTTLPNDIQNLSHLIELDASCNKLGSIPETLGKIQSLSVINLSGNLIQNLPADFFALDFPARKATLSIDLSYNLLTEFHAEWYKMDHLKELDLSRNKIGKISGGKFSKEMQLESLKLAHNKTQRVDLSSIKRLPHLQTLCLEGNTLSTKFTKTIENYLGDNIDSQERMQQTIVDNLSNISLQTNNIDTIYLTMHSLSYFPCLKRLLVSFYQKTPNARCISTKSLRRKVGYADMRGKREFMEDAFDIKAGMGTFSNIDIYSLFDGHGNDIVSSLAAKIIPPSILHHLTNHLVHFIQPENQSDFFINSRLSKLQNQPKMPSASQFILKIPKNSRIKMHKTRFISPAKKINHPNILKYQFENHDEKNGKKQEIKSMFNKIFQEFNNHIDERKEQGGSTAVVAVFIKDECYVANTGDSRAILVRNSKAIRVSQDHHPNLAKEYRRIRGLGGCISSDGRVNGGLAISRALGDLEFSPLVTCKPHVSSFSVSENDQFLIIFCDGISDVLSDQQIADIAVYSRSPSKAALLLRNTAYALGSTDNISVIVISLNPWKNKNSQVLIKKKKRNRNRKKNKIENLDLNNHFDFDLNLNENENLNENQNENLNENQNENLNENQNEIKIQNLNENENQN
ncbi:hypothetical protein M0811_10772 [Anaeramoeba ignava]|uniref:PPM-type phosphatase domain-containing protein n=1 Tax=Anaeramoeba ignava TaxID=1746090 RepID=A0A9Q0LD25_ANAIG|nr:hypothetical protein M0811_10772 [Anaeramoeba ignava]